MKFLKRDHAEKNWPISLEIFCDIDKKNVYSCSKLIFFYTFFFFSHFQIFNRYWILDLRSGEENSTKLNRTVFGLHGKLSGTTTTVPLSSELNIKNENKKCLNYIFLRKQPNKMTCLFRTSTDVVLNN